MIELRWADNDLDRLPELASDLVHRQVRVIVALPGNAAVRAAKAVTNTIPIVFGFGSDPVQQGLVASLNRPGGNVTGMTSLSNELFGKQLGMLHELLLQASHFGFLSNPKTPVHELAVKDVQTAASAIGGTIEVFTASTSGSIPSLLASSMKSACKGSWCPTIRFFSLHAFNWPFWRRALQSLRSILSANRPRLAGC